MPIIAEIDPEELLILDVELGAQEDLNLSKDEHMSFDHELWKNITANREVHIQVGEGLGSRRIQQFLESASNVEEISLDALVYKDAGESNRIGRFSSLKALKSWPGLKWMTLKDMILDCDVLVGILHAHRSTMMTIRFSYLGFNHRTWHEPIGCLTTMTNLCEISLNSLLEELLYSEVESPTGANINTADRYQDSGPLLRVGPGAPLAIKEILDALLSNFHTYKAYTVVYGTDKEFPHRLDLREAAAIVNRTEW